MLIDAPNVDYDGKGKGNNNSSEQVKMTKDNVQNIVSMLNNMNR
jgi:hypothetical protein